MPAITPAKPKMGSHGGRDGVCGIWLVWDERSGCTLPGGLGRRQEDAKEWIEKFHIFSSHPVEADVNDDTKRELAFETCVPG